MKAKNKSKAMADPYPPVDVCCGGTIPVGQNYIPFVNSTGTFQTVSNCVLWGGVAVAVAPTSGSQTHNVPITVKPLPPKGDYSFSSTCLCPNEISPVVKIQ
jgi:hypothetical protein